jgi:hypothetical protein
MSVALVPGDVGHHSDDAGHAALVSNIREDVFALSITVQTASVVLSRSAKSDRIITKRRRPTVVVTSWPVAINS